MPCPMGADPPQLLDVDVDQLAGTAAAHSGGSAREAPGGESLPRPIRFSTAETVEVAISRVSAISGPVSRRRRRAAIASTRSGGGGVVDAAWGGAAIEQAGLAFGAVAAHPFAGRPRAHSGGLGRLRERDPLLEHSPDHDRPALRAEGRVSVELHPVPPWCWGFDTASLQGGPDEQRALLENSAWLRSPLAFSSESLCSSSAEPAAPPARGRIRRNAFSRRLAP